MNKDTTDIVRKVKVIRGDRAIDTYDDYYTRSIFFPASGDWEEMNNQEYMDLQEAVRYANMQSRDGSYYFTIEYTENMIEDVFQSASDFKRKMREREKKENERKEAERRRRDEKAKERKRKQLEKLKRELGDE